MARGYQRGVVAAVPAAVGASAISVLKGWPSPLEGMAEQLMQWTPPVLADYLLGHIGALARPGALLGALALVMLAGGLAGALHAAPGCSSVREVTGYLLAALFLAIVLLVLVPPSMTEPELAFILGFVPSLALVRIRSSAQNGRREFLERSGLILGGAALLVSLFSIEPVFGALATRRLFAFRPRAGLRIDGLTSLVTPTERFYVMDKVLETPRFGPPGWHLMVDGLVQKPLELDYGALFSRPHRNRYVTCECVDNPVGGPLISTALWTGVLVADILREAGARGEHVTFHAADNYAESAPATELIAADAFIAFGMNGETLPREHGFPARLILPGVYGFKSVKWLTGVEVTADPHAGSWHIHGWSDTARIHTTTRIDVARHENGRLTVAGIAFAGRRGVEAVEVRVNGGPWRRASLGPSLGDQTWRQWAIIFNGSRPAHIDARAIDGSGAVQSAQRRGAYPDGSSGWATADV